MPCRQISVGRLAGSVLQISREHLAEPPSQTSRPSSPWVQLPVRTTANHKNHINTATIFKHIKQNRNVSHALFSSFSVPKQKADTELTHTNCLFHSFFVRRAPFLFFTISLTTNGHFTHSSKVAQFQKTTHVSITFLSRTQLRNHQKNQRTSTCRCLSVFLLMISSSFSVPLF